MARKAHLRMLALILAFFGVLVIILSVYPIIQYEYVSRKRFPRLVSPITEQEHKSILMQSLKDYKELGNWSSEYDLGQGDSDSNEYRLSIPRLKITNAQVYVGGEDLSKSLIQYPGTARPGQIGNTVIFGHSVLPIFFNPKDYLTIFSTIPKLKTGGEIVVNSGSVMYKYLVSEMFEVNPDNLNILDQRYDDSFLSLVTCVPPGHPLNPRRLVVRAKIVKI